MKPIALFGATYLELKPLLKEFEIRSEWKEKETHLFEAVWKEIPLWVVRSGVGKKKAEKACAHLLKKTSLCLGVSVGLCGALSPKLEVGETLLGAEVLDLESGETFRSKPWPQKTWEESLFVTSKDALGPKQKRKVHSLYPEAQVCDMETSAIAALLQKKDIPWIVLRSVLETQSSAILEKEDPIISKVAAQNAKDVLFLLTEVSKIFKLNHNK